MPDQHVLVETMIFCAGKDARAVRVKAAGYSLAKGRGWVMGLSVAVQEAYLSRLSQRCSGTTEASAILSQASARYRQQQAPHLV